MDGDPILPSVVGLAEDGRLLVGKPARNQYVLAPDRTVKSIKRKMGEDVTVTLGGRAVVDRVAVAVSEHLGDREHDDIAVLAIRFPGAP